MSGLQEGMEGASEGGSRRYARFEQCDFQGVA